MNAFFAAVLTVYEFFPLHVVDILYRQISESGVHQEGQLTAMGQTQVLPQVVTPTTAPGNAAGQPAF